MLHLLSLGPDESLDVVERYQNIRRELEKYDPELAQKPEVIVLTKQDLVDEEELEIVMDLLRDVVGKKTDPTLFFNHRGQRRSSEEIRLAKIGGATVMLWLWLACTGDDSADVVEPEKTLLTASQEVIFCFYRGAWSPSFSFSV